VFQYKTYINIFKLLRCNYCDLFLKWALSVVLFLSLIYLGVSIKLAYVNKLTLSILVIFFFCYYLWFGFTNFVKLYRFSRYTSSIQRFWRRTFAAFWGLEFGVFVVFLYLTAKASSEPIYVYDYLRLHVKLAPSYKDFLFRSLLYVYAISALTHLLLVLRWSLWTIQVYYIVAATALLVYIVYLDFYQFIYAISTYGGIQWSFDVDILNWWLQPTYTKNRPLNHYIMLCLVVKFWHVVFVFLFWLFFIIRSIEISKLRFLNVSLNTQNTIIIYILSWVPMFIWIQYASSIFFSSQYYWCFINCRSAVLRLFFLDAFNFYKDILSYALPICI